MLLNVPVMDLIDSQLNIGLDSANGSFSCSVKRLPFSSTGSMSPSSTAVSHPPAGLVLTLESVGQHESHSLCLRVSYENGRPSSSGVHVDPQSRASNAVHPQHSPLNQVLVPPMIHQTGFAQDAFLPFGQMPMDSLMDMDIPLPTDNEYGINMTDNHPFRKTRRGTTLQPADSLALNSSLALFDCSVFDSPSGSSTTDSSVAGTGSSTPLELPPYNDQSAADDLNISGVPTTGSGESPGFSMTNGSNSAPDRITKNAAQGLVKKTRSSRARSDSAFTEASLSSFSVLSFSPQASGTTSDADHPSPIPASEHQMVQSTDAPPSATHASQQDHEAESESESQVDYSEKRRTHKNARKAKPRKSFACTMGCSVSFTRPHDRLRHEVVQHGKPCEFTCRPCRCFFSSQKMFDRHTCRSHRRGNLRWPISDNAT